MEKFSTSDSKTSRSKIWRELQRKLLVLVSYGRDIESRSEIYRLSEVIDDSLKLIDLLSEVESKMPSSSKPPTTYMVLTYHLWMMKEVVEKLDKHTGSKCTDGIVTDGFNKGIKKMLEMISSSASSVEALIETARMPTQDMAMKNAPVVKKKLPVLPYDIVAEIFARSPVKSVLRFRATCRALCNRTYQKDFIYQHLDLSKKRFLRFDTMVHIIDPMASSDMSSATPDYLQPVSLLSSVIHCDGLVLFQNPDLCRLSLWNPLFKALRVIRPMGVLTTHDYYGVGYTSDQRQGYKILRIYDADWKADDRENENAVQVYDTKTGTWSVVQASPLDWKVDSLRPGLSVKGIMYWVALSKAVPGHAFIESFNFSNEMFTSVCPLPLYYHRQHANALSVYNDNSLSLLHQGQNTNTIDVWVTNPLSEEVVSWRHVFTIANEDLPNIRPYYDIGFPVHMLDGNGTLVVLCRERLEERAEDIDDEFDEGNPQMRLYRLGRYGIQGRDNVANTLFYEHHMCGYIYTPSLVWP